MWSTDPSRSVDGNGLLPWVEPRKTRIGLVAGGLGAYWPQFPELLPQLQASARRVSERFSALDCEVIDVGFISDAQEGAAAAEKLRSSQLPIRLLWAPGDKYFPISYAERLAGEAGNAKLVEIPDAKTFVALDQPRRLAEEIAQFAASS